jgi:RNA polymerase sigma factor (sigma-70 family)
MLKITHKIIAGILLITCSITQTVSASPFLNKPMAQTVLPVIPHAAGAVHTQWLRGHEGTVYIIEDAHTSIEAQKNIAAIIDRLNPDLICVEGFDGALGRRIEDAFQSIPHKDRARVSDYLMRSGEMTGAQYAYLMSERAARIVGVERDGDYRKNLDQLHKLSRVGAEILRAMRPYADALATLQTELYPPDIQALDESAFSSRQGRDHIAYISRVIQGIIRYKLPAKKYPALHAVAQSEDEADIDMLDLSRLLPEAREAHAQIKKAALRGDAQYVFEAETCFDAMEKLFSARLTRADFERAYASREEFYTTCAFVTGWLEDHADFLQTEGSVAIARLLPRAFRAAYDFYRLAGIRDKHMVVNTYRALFSHAAKNAVLVSGGFHTAGLTKYLKELDISYVVYRPRLASLSGTLDEQYAHKAAGAYSYPVFDALSFLTSKITLENIFTDSALSGNERRFFIDVLNVLLSKQTGEGAQNLADLAAAYQDVFDCARTEKGLRIRHKKNHKTVLLTLDEAARLSWETLDGFVETEAEEDAAFLAAPEIARPQAHAYDRDAVRIVDVSEKDFSEVKADIQSMNRLVDWTDKSHALRMLEAADETIDSTVFIAYSDLLPVGYAIFVNGTLELVCVVPQARRSGIGRRLLKSTLEWAQAKGFQTITLEISHTTAGLDVFYQDALIETRWKITDVDDGLSRRRVTLAFEADRPLDALIADKNELLLHADHMLNENIALQKTMHAVRTAQDEAQTQTAREHVRHIQQRLARLFADHPAVFLIDPALAAAGTRSEYLRGKVSEMARAITAANEIGDHDRLSELNRIQQRYLEGLARVQLRRVQSLLDEGNTPAASATLLGLMRIYKIHAHEVQWQIVRIYQKEAAEEYDDTRIALKGLEEDGAREFLRLLPFKGWRVRMDEGGAVILTQGRWTKQVVNGVLLSIKEQRQIMYSVMLDFIRSRIHTLESQKADYVTVQQKIAELRYVRDQYGDAFTFGSFSAQAEEQALAILEKVYAWCEAGFVEGKVNARKYLAGILGPDGFSTRRDYEKVIEHIELAVQALEKNRLAELNAMRAMLAKKVTTAVDTIQELKEVSPHVVQAVENARTYISRGSFQSAKREVEALSNTLSDRKRFPHVSVGMRDVIRGIIILRERLDRLSQYREAARDATAQVDAVLESVYGSREALDRLQLMMQTIDATVRGPYKARTEFCVGLFERLYQPGARQIEILDQMYLAMDKLRDDALSKREFDRALINSLHTFTEDVRSAIEILRERNRRIRAYRGTTEDTSLASVVRTLEAERDEMIAAEDFFSIRTEALHLLESFTPADPTDIAEALNGAAQELVEETITVSIADAGGLHVRSSLAIAKLLLGLMGKDDQPGIDSSAWITNIHIALTDMPAYSLDVSDYDMRSGLAEALQEWNSYELIRSEIDTRRLTLTFTGTHKRYITQLSGLIAEYLNGLDIDTSMPRREALYYGAITRVRNTFKDLESGSARSSGNRPALFGLASAALWTSGAILSNEVVSFIGLGLTIGLVAYTLLQSVIDPVRPSAAIPASTIQSQMSLTQMRSMIARIYKARDYHAMAQLLQTHSENLFRLLNVGRQVEAPPRAHKYIQWPLMAFMFESIRLEVYRTEIAQEKEKLRAIAAWLRTTEQKLKAVQPVEEKERVPEGGVTAKPREDALYSPDGKKKADGPAKGSFINTLTSVAPLPFFLAGMGIEHSVLEPAGLLLSGFAHAGLVTWMLPILGLIAGLAVIVSSVMTVDQPKASPRGTDVALDKMFEPERIPALMQVLYKDPDRYEDAHLLYIESKRMLDEYIRPHSERAARGYSAEDTALMLEAIKDSQEFFARFKTQYDIHSADDAFIMLYNLFANKLSALINSKRMLENRRTGFSEDFQRYVQNAYASMARNLEYFRWVVYREETQLYPLFSHLVSAGVVEDPNLLNRYLFSWKWTQVSFHEWLETEPLKDVFTRLHAIAPDARVGHIYDVGEHSTVAVEILEAVPTDPVAQHTVMIDHARAASIHDIYADVRSSGDMWIVLLATLLHDIGKDQDRLPYSPSHPERGAYATLDVILKKLPMAPDEESIRLVRWLIRHHHALEFYTRKRDLDSEDTVYEVFDLVRELPEKEYARALKMLCLITYADIRAVDPERSVSTVLNGILMIYGRLREHVNGTNKTWQAEVHKAHREWVRSLTAADDAVVEQYLALMPPETIHEGRARIIQGQIAFLKALDDSPRVIVHKLIESDNEPVNEVIIAMRGEDTKGKVRMFSGMLFLYGLNIYRTELRHHPDGIIWNRFVCKSAYAYEAGELRQKQAQLQADLERLYTGAVTIEELFREKGIAYRFERNGLDIADVPTRVTFPSGESASHGLTRLRLQTTDRRGLLHMVTRILSREYDITIKKAVIDTYAYQVDDVFYVHHNGKEITPEVKSSIKRRLEHVLDQKVFTFTQESDELLAHAAAENVPRATQNAERFKTEYTPIPGLGQKPTRLVDTRTGTAIESYSYEPNGRDFTVALFDPALGRTIRCEISHKEKVEETECLLKVAVENLNYGDFDDAGLVHFVMDEKSVTIRHIKLYENKVGVGIGKPVLRWIALFAHRHNKRLRMKAVRKVHPMFLYRDLYELSTLVISKGGFSADSSDYSSIPFEGEEGFRELLYREQLILVGDEFAGEHVFETDGESLRPEELPWGYTREFKNKQITVYDAKGRLADLYFKTDAAFYLDGRVDPEKIYAQMSGLPGEGKEARPVEAPRSRVIDTPAPALIFKYDEIAKNVPYRLVEDPVFARRVRRSLRLETIKKILKHEEVDPGKAKALGEKIRADNSFYFNVIFDTPYSEESVRGLWDGHHRREGLEGIQADFVFGQEIDIEDPGIEIYSWAKIVGPVSASLWEALKTDYMLSGTDAFAAESARDTHVLYNGKVYRPGVGSKKYVPIADDFNRAYPSLAGTPLAEKVIAHTLRKQFLAEIAQHSGLVSERLPFEGIDQLQPGQDVLAVIDPVFTKDDIRAVVQNKIELASGATRFVLPFRVIGLGFMLDYLYESGDWSEKNIALINAHIQNFLEKCRLVSFGRDVTFDREYPEEVLTFLPPEEWEALDEFNPFRAWYLTRLAAVRDTPDELLSYALKWHGLEPGEHGSAEKESPGTRSDDSESDGTEDGSRSTASKLFSFVAPLLAFSGFAIDSVLLASVGLGASAWLVWDRTLKAYFEHAKQEIETRAIDVVYTRTYNAEVIPDLAQYVKNIFAPHQERSVNGLFALLKKNGCFIRQCATDVYHALENSLYYALEELERDPQYPWSVRVEIRSDGRGYVVTDIIDNGPGISRARLEQVIRDELSYSTASAQKKIKSKYYGFNSGGRGLFLHMILTEHSGKVDIEIDTTNQGLRSRLIKDESGIHLNTEVADVEAGTRLRIISYPYASGIGKHIAAARFLARAFFTRVRQALSKASSAVWRILRREVEKDPSAAARSAAVRISQDEIIPFTEESGYEKTAFFAPAVWVFGELTGSGTLSFIGLTLSILSAAYLISRGLMHTVGTNWRVRSRYVSDETQSVDSSEETQLPIMAGSRYPVQEILDSGLVARPEEVEALVSRLIDYPKILKYAQTICGEYEDAYDRYLRPVVAAANEGQRSAAATLYMFQEAARAYEAAIDAQRSTTYHVFKRTDLAGFLASEIDARLGRARTIIADRILREPEKLTRVRALFGEIRELTLLYRFIVGEDALHQGRDTQSRERLLYGPAQVAAVERVVGLDKPHTFDDPFSVLLRRLSKAEEKELFRLYRIEKNGVAFDLIVKINLRRVRRDVLRYCHALSPGTTSLEQVVSAANYGLLQAMKKFHVSRGIYFYSYAWWWIRRGITAYFKVEKNVVRVPEYMHDRIRYITDADAAFFAAHKRTPDSLKELIAFRPELAAKVTQKQYAIVAKIYENGISGELTSFDEPVNRHDKGGRLHHEMHMSDGIDEIEMFHLKASLDRVYQEFRQSRALANEKMPKRAYDIILRRGSYDPETKEFKKAESLEEIGAYYQISRQGVHQIVQKHLPGMLRIMKWIDPDSDPIRFFPRDITDRKGVPKKPRDRSRRSLSVSLPLFWAAAVSAGLDGLSALLTLIGIGYVAAVGIRSMVGDYSFRTRKYWANDLRYISDALCADPELFELAVTGELTVRDFQERAAPGSITKTQSDFTALNKQGFFIRKLAGRTYLYMLSDEAKKDPRFAQPLAKIAKNSQVTVPDEAEYHVDENQLAISNGGNGKAQQERAERRDVLSAIITEYFKSIGVYRVILRKEIKPIIRRSKAFREKYPGLSEQALQRDLNEDERVRNNPNIDYETRSSSPDSMNIDLREIVTLWERSDYVLDMVVQSAKEKFFKYYIAPTKERITVEHLEQLLERAYRIAHRENDQEMLSRLEAGGIPAEAGRGLARERASAPAKANTRQKSRPAVLAEKEDVSAARVIGRSEFDLGPHDERLLEIVLDLTDEKDFSTPVSEVVAKYLRAKNVGDYRLTLILDSGAEAAHQVMIKEMQALIGTERLNVIYRTEENNFAYYANRLIASSQARDSFFVIISAVRAHVVTVRQEENVRRVATPALNATERDSRLGIIAAFMDALLVPARDRSGKQYFIFDGSSAASDLESFSAAGKLFDLDFLKELTGYVTALRKEKLLRVAA